MRLPLILLASIAATTAHAAPSRDDVTAYVKNANAECRVALRDPLQTGHVTGSAAPVTLAIYTVEDCGGGMNYTTEFAAFHETPQGLTRYALDPHLIGRVQTARIAGGQIIVTALDFGPHDPYCCPKIHQHFRFIVKNGALAPI
jgi:hypothetical protein